MNTEKKEAYSIERLLERCGSIYKLVIVASKRALEISEGSPRLVETSPKEKPALIALREKIGRASCRERV